MGCFCAAHFSVFVTEELQRSEKVLLRFQHLTDSLIVLFFSSFFLVNSFRSPLSSVVAFCFGAPWGRF